MEKRYLIEDDTPGGEWRQMPDLPTEEELLSIKDAEILIKPIDPNPGAKQEYLGNQYKLCRVEGTELIRRALRRFRDNPDMPDTKDFYIYTKVRPRSSPEVCA